MNSGNIESDVSAEKIGKAILSLGKKLEDAVAIGVCGSLARGDFHERSDIDIFVIVKERLVDDRIWWDRISDVLQDFGRDVTVLVYTVEGLKRIITWYVLRLASEGVLVYDRGDIRGLFNRIISAAKEAGLVEVQIGDYKVWSVKNLKFAQRLTLEVRE